MIDSGNEHYLNTDKIISCYHERGTDELVNRALKNFASEQLPFKRFAQNAAWYYIMLVGFFLFETFKKDVIVHVIPDISVNSYADTVRRKFID